MRSVRIGRMAAAIAVSGAALLGWDAARAELPPSVYMQQQKSAPEAVRIEVLRVEGMIDEGEEQRSDLVVTARVLCVGRSAAGLKPGEEIAIAYATVVKHRRGWAGPRPLPILTAGPYPAYLAKAGDRFAPAASGWSFAAFPAAPGTPARDVCARE